MPNGHSAVTLFSDHSANEIERPSRFAYNYRTRLQVLHCIGWIHPKSASVYSDRVEEYSSQCNHCKSKADAAISV
jgi:hypothetical protein